MNALDYAEALARVIKSSSRVELILRREYEKSITAFVGTAQDRQDWQAATPYAGVTAFSSRERSNLIASEVTLELGLYDESVTRENGIPRLHAYDVLKELIPAIVRDLKDQVLSLATTAYLDEMRVEFSQADFPLVTATVTFDIEETIPVGRWLR